MKKLITMLLALMAAAAFATDLFPLAAGAAEQPQPEQSKTYTWHTYGVTATNVYSTVNLRAVLFNANDFGFDYPVNFNGVQSYLYDAGYTSSYRIYAKDGVTLLWQSDDFTTTKIGYEVVRPAAPIVLNDDFYLVHVPFLPGDGKGYPRILLSNDGVLGHGFYGQPGAWTNRDPYAYMMYAALEQYTGPDINPPSARFVYGANAFQDYDANLVLAVSDESTITTLTGAYTVDGGTTWVNVEMSAAKANHFEYTGTVPAQPDGSEGQVVFFMTDDLGQSSESEPFDLTWSKDNPIYSQGFEGLFPPVGWSTNYVGAGFIQADKTTYTAHSGNYSAFHMDDSGLQDDWLITPKITIPATDSATLTFWEFGYFVAYYGYHEVCVSTDMATWTTLYSGVPVENSWEQLYLSLKDYAGQDIYIGFHYQGDWSDWWFIDDVEVLYDYEGPTIVDLVGNEALLPVVGAFLNNEMNLSVTVNDLSGVQSVVGHYSFDEGATIVDLPFAKAKGGDEVWTATIPQQAAVDSGYINFDVTDIGGIASPLSADYRIDFVQDTDAPVFHFVKGTLAFVNSPMNLEISFSDESAMTSCAGFYSKDGITYTPFTMDPAKIHDYVYVGTIPAETEEVLDGKVYFGMQDVEGHIGYSDIIQVKWMDGQNSIIEDFESGAGNWTFGGDTASNWAIVEEGEYTSATHALTESPGGSYEKDEITFAQWATPFDLTLNPGASIAFWTKFDLETDFDYMYFEGSMDGGTTWIRLKTFNGEPVAWHEEVIPMDAFAGKSNVTFRFLFESDGGYQTNGMYIDDLILTTFNKDHGAPTIISDPYAPAFYEGVFGNYTDQIEVLDFSTVASVTVYYSVDGGAEEFVTAVNTSDDWYEFTIPEQVAGSQVNYRIEAVDGSEFSNKGVSPTYSYISGDHMIYDSGIVSYLDDILDNNAWAVKVTVPGSDTKTVMTGKLAYLLLRNYYDPTHVSATMSVHVWADEAGVPGAELITPIDVVSEAASFANAMTRVDLRSYDLSVTGNFWIGLSAPYGTVYATLERSTETGTPAFGRSYTGTWSTITTSWTWAQVPLDNWHFRAVLNGIYTGIEDESGVPMVTELQQNYPNPFNPATTINFSLAKDTKVSLVVYDVMGREVANLVNKNMVSGSHAVSFDASRLGSGVYYYSLKAGDVNQTKKMMLIK
jgi:hypothetical protein